ncbi:hypothetical protein TcWFU_010501 [Taenia crassiceps]|uniref:Transmembrane protein n=1 Tax=Taenia crassiceps TaxID=6207 RepID=A0ABR4QJM6_9CEST
MGSPDWTWVSLFTGIPDGLTACRSVCETHRVSVSCLYCCAATSFSPCQYHRPSYRRSSSADALPVHSSSLSLLFFSFSSSFTFLLSIVMTKRVGEKSNFTTFIFRPFTYRLPSLPLSLPPSSSSLSSALFSPFSSLPAFYCPVTLLPPPSFNISSSSYAHSSISPFHPPSLHFTPLHRPRLACAHGSMQTPTNVTSA